MKIVVSGTDDHWVGNNTTTGWQGGQTYWLSAHVKAPDGGTFCLSLSAKPGHEDWIGCMVATGDWQILEGAITLPSDAMYFFIVLRPIDTGIYYVDDVQVGRLPEVGVYSKEDNLGNTLWSRRVYDGLGRLIQEQAERNSSQAIVVHRAYDALGQLARQTVPEEMASAETGFRYIPATGSEAATS
ncbi:MAG: hypothetical protein GWN58_19765, partial [Anaerolineae bacterium]|nr:hypothetical protein [Anaerolineae bacterium]